MLKKGNDQFNLNHYLYKLYKNYRKHKNIDLDLNILIIQPYELKILFNYFKYLNNKKVFIYFVFFYHIRKDKIVVWKK